MEKGTIVFVTGNSNKLEEFQSILGKEFPYDIVSQKIDLLEYQGSSEEICIKKCKEAVKVLQRPVIIEDTSLCFNAMGGLPGPYVKCFLKEIGPEGLHKMLLPWQDKSAVAMCIFGYADGTKNELGNYNVELFVGRKNGKIVEPRGPQYYGWDACFQPDGFDQTYAEMDKKAKNTISHYCIALQRIKEFFTKSNR